MQTRDNLLKKVYDTQQQLTGMLARTVKCLSTMPKSPNSLQLVVIGMRSSQGLPRAGLLWSMDSSSSDGYMSPSSMSECERSCMSKRSIKSLLSVAGTYARNGKCKHKCTPIHTHCTLYTHTYHVHALTVQ